MVLSVSKSTPKGNDSLPSGRNSELKEYCVSSARADRLIAVCHSYLGDTLIKYARADIHTAVKRNH